VADLIVRCALVAYIVAALVALAFVSAARAATRPTFVAAWAWRVAVCESRGDFHHHVWNGSGEFEGAWSWYHGTWLLDRVPGAPRHASAASPNQQYRTFLRSVSRGRYFGCMEGR
jgi:hypothetical protein